MHWSSEIQKACCRFKVFVSVNYSKLHYPRLISKSFGNSRRYKCCFVGHNFLVYSKFPSLNNLLMRNVAVSQFKNFHSADDSHNIKDRSDEETYKNIVSDVEFQNILKDFTRDFEVTGESGKILDEIKKKQDNEYDTSHYKSYDSDGSVTAKSFSTDGFRTFSDQDAPVILDYHEEKIVNDSEEQFFHIDQEVKERYENVTERGKTGVFDIAELVALSKDENLLDTTVIVIPDSYHYADYMVLVTAKSPRHLLAFTQFIKKQYKTKKNRSDPYVLVEGEKDSSWRALDMGNIVLHIFLKEARDMYDIESLWTLDKEYDSGGISQADPISEMMQQHLEYLNSLQSPQIT